MVVPYMPKLNLNDLSCCLKYFKEKIKIFKIDFIYP